MTKSNNLLPATRKDLNEVKTELNEKIDSSVKKLDEKIDFSVKQLDKKIDSVKADLKDDIKRVSIYMFKMEEKMATKDDIKRIETKINKVFNLMDSIAGDVKNYQRQDILRGDAVMKHEEKLKDHETRLQKLETE
jgi:hypothetical protein